MNEANDQLLVESYASGSLTNYYDSNGALTNRSSATQSRSFSYNLEGRLAGAQWSQQTNRYFYNSSGIRVRKEQLGMVNATNLFLNDPQNLSGFSQVLEEKPSVGGAPTASYTLGNRIVSQEKSGAVLHLMADGHGSTRSLTDNSGAVVNAFGFDGYGILIASNATPQAANLYTGERFDDDLEQYYLRNRYYNPFTGRFSVPDQLDGNTSDPLSLHKYAYCANNPINNVDPSGNFSLSEITLVGLIGSTLQALPGFVYNKLKDMLQTESSSAAESISAIEDDEANSATATIIIHGVEGLSFSGGHKLGWSKDFQGRLTGEAGKGQNEFITALPLKHDFYEFNWGGFSADMDSVAVVGFVPVKSVHQMAYVHLHIAQMLIWMKGYTDMNVISHSWGTTLAYDMLTTGGIEMKHWVSMGSPLNHEIHKPVWNQGLWINCFSWKDPVVFLDMYPKGSLDGWLPAYAPRFGPGLVGHPEVSQPAVDTSPGGHSSYWDHNGVIQRLREDLQ